MKLLSFIVITQLFIASILAASCTLVVQKVGGKISVDVSDGQCYSLPKSTATRVIRIDGVENQGSLIAYDEAGCGGVNVKDGPSPLVFKNPVMVASSVKCIVITNEIIFCRRIKAFVLQNQIEMNDLNICRMLFKPWFSDALRN